MNQPLCPRREILGDCRGVSKLSRAADMGGRVARGTYQPHQSVPGKMLHGAVTSQVFGLDRHCGHVAVCLLSRGPAKMPVTSTRRKKREALNMLGV